MNERHEEQLEPLEMFLKDCEIEMEIIAKEKICSHMPRSENVFTIFMKVEVNFNLQFNQENADIKNIDEDEEIIREKLFIRFGTRPQVKH